ncbi:hypothetical protein [Phreatobacter stygius]|uniref:hypothetical protein n=1 Tax=Phreatobacter stygius TaxID=1940610 RepID=UPI001476B1E9|nr:hypothetical protein [Phreatobacter stygius]
MADVTYRPVVSAELIALHRRLAHEMRNAAIRAAIGRVARQGLSLLRAARIRRARHVET